MKVLITGGSGFIGSHLVEALVWRGDDVVVLDNLDPWYDPQVKRRNLAAVIDQVEFIQGDILDEGVLDRAMTGVQVVAHLAARAGVRASLQEPTRYVEANIQGTLNVLQAVARHGPHLVNISSSSVYGARTSGPFAEDDALAVPASPYAATKRSAEILVDTWQALYGLSVTTLRLFTVYGPRQRPDMAIHRFLRAVMREEPIALFGDGSSLRDYTYVGDVVAGLLAAMDRPMGRQLFNLGNNQPVRLDRLVEAIEEAVGRPAIIRREPMPAGDVPMTWASIERAREALGFEPRVKLSEGLASFVAWLLEGPAP